MYTNGTYVLKDLKTGSRFPLLSNTLHSQTDCSVENMSGKKGKDMCDFFKIFFGLIFPKWSLLFLFCLRVTYSCWRRKWQPTPMFLLGESQGRGSLVGCHLWGRTDTTEATQQQQQQKRLSSSSSIVKYANYRKIREALRLTIVCFHSLIHSIN